MKVLGWESRHIRVVHGHWAVPPNMHPPLTAMHQWLPVADLLAALAELAAMPACTPLTCSVPCHSGWRAAPAGLSHCALARP